METWGWIVLAVAALVVIVLAALLVRIRRRRSHLKERFGPEYARVVSEAGTGDAESRLSDLEGERDDLEITRLSAAARTRYLDEWHQAEARFVTDPRDATRTADRLVTRALEERGYPADLESAHLADLVSVDHPTVAERYRHGCSMLDKVEGAESTENLRKAMVDFRIVLEDVLEGSAAA
jgi:hypothetical protein